MGPKVLLEIVVSDIAAEYEMVSIYGKVCCDGNGMLVVGTRGYPVPVGVDSQTLECSVAVRMPEVEITTVERDQDSEASSDSVVRLVFPIDKFGCHDNETIVMVVLTIYPFSTGVESKGLICSVAVVVTRTSMDRLVDTLADGMSPGGAN